MFKLLDMAFITENAESFPHSWREIIRCNKNRGLQAESQRNSATFPTCEIECILMDEILIRGNLAERVIKLAGIGRIPVGAGHLGFGLAVLSNLFNVL